MTIRKFVIASVLSLLAIAIAGSADAQFWKKKSRRHTRKHKHELVAEETADADREQRRKEKQERKRKRREGRDGYADVAKKKKTPVKKKKEVRYPATVIKPRYRIEVLSPMYLDELVKGNTVAYKGHMPDKAVAGVSFYQGVNIAADSLRKAGYKIDIFVHDITTAAETVDALIAKGALDSADLIIGAVPTKEVSTLAEYAKKKKINFVSALSASDADVRNNEFFTIAQPTLKSHCEWIADNIEKKFPHQRVALLYRNTSLVDENAYNYLISDMTHDVRYSPRLCNTLPHREDLVDLFNLNKPNVVIIAVLDQGYADTLLQTLSATFPSTHFEVYGMPTWNGIPNLRKAEAYPNLTINITNPFSFDPATPTGQYIARTYKKDYGSKVPMTEYVYRGYELTYWYAYLLKQYGTIFNDKYSDATTAPFTKFEVKPQWSGSRFLFNENKHLTFSVYEGGNYRSE